MYAELQHGTLIGSTLYHGNRAILTRYILIITLLEHIRLVPCLLHSFHSYIHAIGYALVEPWQPQKGLARFIFVNSFDN